MGKTLDFGQLGNTRQNDHEPLEMRTIPKNTEQNHSHIYNNLFSDLKRANL